MKRTHVLTILVLMAFIFLIVALLYKPLGDAVSNGLAQATGGASNGIASTWSQIASNPTYQQFHMLIWFIGGIVFTGLVLSLHKRGKIPLLRRGQTNTNPPAMGPPQTIIVTQQPVSSGVKPTQAQPQLDTSGNPVAPLDPTKTQQQNAGS